MLRETAHRAVDTRDAVEKAGLKYLQQAHPDDYVAKYVITNDSTHVRAIVMRRTPKVRGKAAVKRAKRLRQARRAS